VTDNDQERYDVFEELYQSNIDPWDVETSEYEAAKRLETLKVMGDRKFAHILEVGCGTGVLTQMLAEHAENVTAMDLSPTAIAAAKKRLKLIASVKLVCGDILSDQLNGPFDCAIVSEVLYFLDPEEISRAAELIHTHLQAGGLCELVNWTGENDCPISGPEAVQHFLEGAEWSNWTTRTFSSYQIDTFRT
jgi:2-polyprenyl-3-methyl-5-hydroxy-6-metoxy-1,4-benzoquinol methylase